MTALTLFCGLSCHVLLVRLGCCFRLDPAVCAICYSANARDIVVPFSKNFKFEIAEVNGKNAQSVRLLSDDSDLVTHASPMHSGDHAQTELIRICRRLQVQSVVVANFFVVAEVSLKRREVMEPVMTVTFCPWSRPLVNDQRTSA